MRRRRLSSSSAGSQGPSRPQAMNVIEEDSSLDISPFWVLSFVVFMATMLVVLYFFIKYLGLYRLEYSCESLYSFIALGAPH
ncbi:hypothetical protein MTO96_046161 [Rhipicephalus appendiculatus]